MPPIWKSSKRFFPPKELPRRAGALGCREGQILYPEEIEMAQLHTTPPLLGASQCITVLFCSSGTACTAGSTEDDRHRTQSFSQYTVQWNVF